MRPSGIEIIGDVPWGTHFCEFYETGADLVETLVPYFRAGLLANEFCMWVTSEPLGTAQAKAALKKAVPDLEARMKRGQIEILDYSQWYTKSGKFNSDEVLRGWVDKHEAALKKGFEGLRLTGNTFWLEDADWGDFAAYEKAVNDVIGRYRMIALCTYSLKKCSTTEILEVMANHEFALIKRRNRWETIECARIKATEQALRNEISERTRVQDDLAEANRRIATILDTIADGFYALDDDLRFAMINDAALSYFGRTREEMLGRALHEVFPESRGSDFNKRLQEARVSRQPVHFETPSLISDKIVKFHVYPGIGTTSVLFRDVTKEARLAEALRQSEQRQAAFAAATFEGIVLSEEGRILDCNEQFALMAGRSVEELKGTPVGDLIAPEDRDRVTANISQAQESVIEHLMVRKDGSRLVVEAHGRPMADASPGRRLTAVRDITERKRAEQALFDSALFPAQNPHPVLRLAADGSILFANDASAELLMAWGGPSEPRVPIEVLQAMNLALQTNRVSTRELPVGSRTFLLTVAPIVARGYANLYGMDITKLKLRETELEKLNRISAAHSRSDQALMRSENEADYLQEVCRIVVEDCGHAMVWIGMAEDDEGKTVRPVASAGFEEGYLRNLRVTWADTDRGRGPTGTAIRTGQPAGCEDMTTDPKFAPWREEAVRRGYASSLALPLLAGGRVLGAITVYARQPKAFSLEEVELMSDLADDLAYGITALRLRKAHREFEEALRRSEERYRSLVDLSPDAIYVNREDRVMFVNPAALRLFGAERPEDILGRSVWDIFHPDCHEMIGRRLVDARAGLPQPLVEEKIVRLDGSPVDVEVASAPYATDQGPATQVILRDITERKRAEEELRRRSQELQTLTETLEERVIERTAELGRANERLREEIAERRRLVAAVEQDSGGVVIASADGTVAYVNPAFERLSGRPARELRGRRCASILTADGVDPKAAAAIEDAMTRGTSWNGRVSRKISSGQTAELELSLSPIRDETSRVVDYLATVRDVTYELRLQQHFRQTQKTEALGTLAGGIAHDLNNVLNPIFINTELVLLDAPLDEPMRRTLELTLKAAERGRDLVKQIITFSRQKERERKPVKVGPIVEESLKFLRASLPRTVDIRTSIQPESGTILADPVQIHQVVMNLCSNAAFAMRDSGGVLEVALAEVEADEAMTRRHPSLKPGPYLRLTVADSGMGMSPEVLDRAFDPFFTTKGPGEGSGMGLAVVQGIVRDHGGAITVYSEVGQGSTFNVYLPRLGGRGNPHETQAEALVRGSEHLLLVDDEEAQALSLKNMLEHLGYRVTVRTDGAEALALFRKNPGRFDLVLTDQAMPRMTGGKLAQEMLKLRPDLPVILCTGFSEQVDANGARKLGLREFLMKPFSVREVSAAIRRALAKK